MTRLAVFDCDGTLIDSQASIVRAMTDAFASVGLAAPDPLAVRRLVGLSLPGVVRALLPGADEGTVASVTAAYRDAFRSLRASGELIEPLYDGITDMLSALQVRGWSLGVATGKSDRGLALALASHGLADTFITLQTADRHPSKPYPAMLRAAIAEAGSASGQAVMIGDTSYDMAMARAADVRAVGVGWGYHGIAELVAAGAAAIADHPHHLIDLLETP